MAGLPLPAPAVSRVRLQISEEAILGMLGLPDGTALLGAETEQWRGPRLVLHLEMPGVPDGADEVTPVYEAAGMGPVTLAGLRWSRDGDEIAASA